MTNLENKTQNDIILKLGLLAGVDALVVPHFDLGGNEKYIAAGFGVIAAGAILKATTPYLRKLLSSEARESQEVPAIPSETITKNVPQSIGPSESTGEPNLPVEQMQSKVTNEMRNNLTGSLKHFCSQVYGGCFSTPPRNFDEALIDLQVHPFVSSLKLRPSYPNAPRVFPFARGPNGVTAYEVMQGRHTEIVISDGKGTASFGTLFDASIYSTDIVSNDDSYLLINPGSYDSWGSKAYIGTEMTVDGRKTTALSTPKVLTPLPHHVDTNHLITAAHNYSLFDSKKEIRASRILYVDDSENYRSSFSKQFPESATCRTQREARKYISRNTESLDLVITDLELGPFSNGYNVARCATEHGIPVLLKSARSSSHRNLHTDELETNTSIQLTSALGNEYTSNYERPKSIIWDSNTNHFFGNIASQLQTLPSLAKDAISENVQAHLKYVRGLYEHENPNRR